MEDNVTFSHADIYRDAGAISVCWLKNGVPMRKAYDADQKDEFIADLENPDLGGAPGMADAYLAELGW